ncbi:MAG: SDR family oxidoreductase [Candidatus Velamenicoccus archaeovorus]
MILVTGATGNVGSGAVRGLVRAGRSVRAFVRDPGKARAMLDGEVELAVGELGDETCVRGALAGVDALLVCHLIGREPRSFGAFARAHRSAFAGQGPGA